MIKNTILQLDLIINRQLSRIIYHLDFLLLKKNWQDIYALCIYSQGTPDLLLQLFPWLDQPIAPSLNHLLLQQRFEQPGALPFSLLAINHEKTSDITDECFIAIVWKNEQWQLIIKTIIYCWKNYGWFTPLLKPLTILDINNRLIISTLNISQSDEMTINQTHQYYWINGVSPLVIKLCLSRFALSLKCILRNKIGSSLSNTDVCDLIRNWLYSYTPYPLIKYSVDLLSYDNRHFFQIIIEIEGINLKQKIILNGD